MAANILDIVREGNNVRINANKLRELCRKTCVWDYFGVKKEDFLNLSDLKQTELTSKFYFENVNKQQQESIDASIGSIINSSSSINLKKVYENGENRTEISLSSSKDEEKKKPFLGHVDKKWLFCDECCDFSLKKANMPENILFYVNQGYQSYKDGKKCYYNDIYIVAQIMPLAYQPKDIESYDRKDNEVKILRARYDPANGTFLGIENCVALITVKNDPEEQFFDYGYFKANSKMLYSTRKSKIPSSFKATAFGTHKNQYDGGVFLEQEFSKIFFYLPSTVGRCEEINKYLTSAYLKPYQVDTNDLGVDLNPAISSDREPVVKCMKKIAEQSSQNLKRNADAHLAGIEHDNDTLMWPGGKRTVSNKFSLTY